MGPSQEGYNCCMALFHKKLALLVIAVLLPFLALAQEDTLHATIRADIVNDPRSSEMSSAEIDTLVNALAAQAQEQGIAQDYLDSQNSFNTSAEAPFFEESPVSTTPLTIALITLFIVLTGVAIFLIWQRNIRRSMPPSAGMVA